MSKDAIELSGLPNAVKCRLRMNSVHQIMKDKGLLQDGSVQAFHTANVLRRIIKYMPYRTGATIKVTIAQTDVNKPYIVTDVPYGKYLYYGKVMVGNAPRSVTDKDLRYTKTKNPQAGPYWDRALVANEQAVLQRELQSYINRKRVRG